MSAPDGGGMSAQTAVEVGSDSESGSSYIGSGESGPHSATCQWRTTRFNDQECSRYFDCPSHIVERALSQSEEGDDEDHAHEHEHEHEHEPRHEHREQEETEMTDSYDNHSEPGTVSPGSQESAGEGHQRQTSPSAVSPLPDTLPAAESRQTHNDGDEVEITGTRNITDGPRVQESMLRHAIPGEMASGTAENPIVLSDSPPTRTTQSQQPYITPSSASSSRAEPEIQGTSSRRLTWGDPHLYTGFGGERASPLPPIPTGGQTVSSGVQASLSRWPLAGVSQPRSPDFVVPRWQPDAEVTLCPICNVQFSIFVRKHHCRKCGRVVCNACSPHRITIPYQYIVQPPGAPLLPRYPLPVTGRIDDDLSRLMGGDKVRLCNPCVPDPNTAPPQTQGAHSQSQSNLPRPYPPRDTRQNPSRWSSYFDFAAPGGPPGEVLHARSRSVTIQPGEVLRNGLGPNTQYYQTSSGNRILSGTPPTYLLPPRPLRARPMPSSSSSSSAAAAGSSSTHPAADRHLPALPQYHRIPEEDECPVCHRELPPRTLPNFEALREAHITICITSHSTYSGGVPTPDSGGGAGGNGGGSPPLPRVPPRRTGMFPYVATEKDCVDSAECTICLEEFEVGVPMARLECLCRFHRECICAWWERHPGRCPVHQHDGYGY